MTFEQVNEIFDYWKWYPPLRDLIAGFLDFKPADEDAPKYMSAADMRRMMAQTGGKMPGVGPNMGAPKR
jgi:hypothetical protein